MATTHRFQIGQSVRFASASMMERGAAGPYKVIAQLPETAGDWQYRIKSIDHSRERVAPESQLSAVGSS